MGRRIRKVWGLEVLGRLFKKGEEVEVGLFSGARILDFSGGERRGRFG